MSKNININQQEEVIFGVTIILNMEVTMIEIKTLSVEKYLNRIRPYLKVIKNYLKKAGTWKIQLTIAINFISSIDNDVFIMHSKSNNIEIVINDEADEVIKKTFSFT